MNNQFYSQSLNINGTSLDISGNNLYIGGSLFSGSGVGLFINSGITNNDLVKASGQLIKQFSSITSGIQVIGSGVNFSEISGFSGYILNALNNNVTNTTSYINSLSGQLFGNLYSGLNASGINYNVLYNLSGALTSGYNSRLSDALSLALSNQSGFNEKIFQMSGDIKKYFSGLMTNIIISGSGVNQSQLLLVSGLLNSGFNSGLLNILTGSSGVNFSHFTNLSGLLTNDINNKFFSGLNSIYSYITDISGHLRTEFLDIATGIISNNWVNQTQFINLSGKLQNFLATGISNIVLSGSGVNYNLLTTTSGYLKNYIDQKISNLNLSGSGVIQYDQLLSVSGYFQNLYTGIYSQIENIQNQLDATNSIVSGINNQIITINSNLASHTSNVNDGVQINNNTYLSNLAWDSTIGGLVVTKSNNAQYNILFSECSSDSTGTNTDPNTPTTTNTSDGEITIKQAITDKNPSGRGGYGGFYIDYTSPAANYVCGSSLGYGLPSWNGSDLQKVCAKDTLKNRKVKVRGYVQQGINIMIFDETSNIQNNFAPIKRFYENGGRVTQMTYIDIEFILLKDQSMGIFFDPACFAYSTPPNPLSIWRANIFVYFVDENFVFLY